MPKAAVTPIRQQYLQIKRQHPDAIVFFRLGDFYETFDADAQIAARELDVVLTSRNVAKGQRVPMAGVPYHAAEGYVARLIAKGYKVAICEQVGEPVNGLMPREVVRVVTPGTVVEPTLLTDKRNNYLAAVVVDDGAAGIAYADITTGEFATTQLTGAAVAADVLRELDRLAPAEVLLSDGGDPFHAHGDDQTAEALRRYPYLEGLEAPLTLYDEWRWELGNCRQALLDHFEVTTLAGYGCEGLPLAQRAAGVLIQYLRQHQASALAQLTGLATYAVDGFMALDAATRRSLELTETIRDRTVKGSLLGVLDRTLTPMGGRLLRRWVSQPLLDREALEARLTAVDACFGDLAGRTALRSLLHGIGDLERLTNRVVQGIAQPRDLVGLRNALERVAEITARLAEMVAASTVAGAGSTYPLDGTGLNPCPEARDLIARAIVDDPPATLGGGRCIRPGFSAELDGIEHSVRDAKQWVASLERVERERTGIKNLKVGYNKVFGYYIEVTKANADAVPADYVRKQTLVNAERYIMPELKEREALILHAEERTRELEAHLFRGILTQLATMAGDLLETARSVAHLDAVLSLAEVAAVNDYVRPELMDDGTIDIVGGRHPVVEQSLPQQTFVPNDTHLSAEAAVHIITGPNMSGKSTYLRQVALIVLLAQIGSFVPASAARLGLVDRIFARVGAQDEIAAGQSTFMVEMVEMANILNHATARSLLILDEIGRGTSTYDGISIAWSVVEYIHNHPRLGCKTLFATHYHELTDLERFLPRVRNYNVAVAGEGGRVVFTHQIVPGGADRSYGIHVGQMAGLPPTVIHRAEEILKDLEGAAHGARVGTGTRVIRVKQLPLFGGTHPVVEELRALDVVAMSPLEALTKLFELQQKAE
ncbi:MAG TPA: DNA mismatch repair protein MutS [Chloroflexi bacterium]|jgi:DNA mismatch repair protein MutS|nr:DNA mismatch repair protein MutS [Chloroflexota bacterium]